MLGPFLSSLSLFAEKGLILVFLDQSKIDINAAVIVAALAFTLSARNSSSIPNIVGREARP